MFFSLLVIKSFVSLKKRIFAFLVQGPFQGGWKEGGRSEVIKFSSFSRVGGGRLAKKGWRQYFRVGLIHWRTLRWIFGKWFMKMLKKTSISQQAYLYIRVLKFYKVLFCTYCKGLLCLQITVIQLLCLYSSVNA